MARPHAKNRKKNKKEKPVATCPASGIEFQGNCPVKTCPAWHENATRHKCVTLTIHNPSKFNVASVYGMVNARAKSQYRSDVALLTRYALFINQALSFPNSPTACSKCGVELPDSTRLQCLNPVRCRKREKFAKKQLDKAPFKVLDSKSLSHFWQVFLDPKCQELFDEDTVEYGMKLIKRLQH